MTKVLFVILIGSLITILFRTRNLWPRSPETITGQSDYVDVNAIISEPGLGPLPRVTAQTFFDIEIEGEYVGRIVMGLFGDTVPKTVNNFLTLCSGERGPDLHYKNMRFHRIIPGFIVQGGDILRGDGTGSISIYGSQFDDEAAGLALKHDRPYLLQMANSGRNTNGSQFCIMLGAAPHLNGLFVGLLILSLKICLVIGHHVVFGRVLSGFHVVDRMGQTGGDGELPTKAVVVVDSGIVHPPS